jgi:hypothetical protein
MAEAFLARLDGDAAFFSFRTFSDTPYTRRLGGDPLEHAIHGSLQACWWELTALNQAGAAVAVTINQTSARGRAVDDIVRVRALFMDDDRGTDPGSFRLPPHLRVITSERHNHYYWLVRDLEISDFKLNQSRLAARYDGDHRVTALNQAMQLPGFWRRKRISCPRMPRLELLSDRPSYPAFQIQGLLAEIASD